MALNLLSSSPTWLTRIGALPMYLGLDLRGGVHFLLQVDMKGALTKRLDAFAADVRTTLRDKGIRHSGVSREGNRINVRFRDTETREKARRVIADAFGDLQVVEAGDAAEPRLDLTIKPEAEKRIQEAALKQNIGTLNKRVNELGVAEPVIQQQGADRIVVQLPGVQDTARAKEILGRTATLEIRMVDEENSRNMQVLADAQKGQVPFGAEFYVERQGAPLLVKKQVLLTGDRLTDAQAGFDNQTQEPAVHLTLDSTGARIFRDITRENVGESHGDPPVREGQGRGHHRPGDPHRDRRRPGADQRRPDDDGRGERHRAAPPLRRRSPRRWRSSRSGPSVRASARRTSRKASTRPCGGSPRSPAFMIVYYVIFGLFSSIALAANVLFLVALLSLLQATLTLPGIAAIALTLGMAIDANVLINERIREELRAGQTPQAAIRAGYERAFGTIVDSNVTTLIAGLMLLIFGSGPVRGFAVVHCLGILTSMFSSVVVSRALANLFYGTRRRLERIAIGNTSWK